MTNNELIAEIERITDLMVKNETSRRDREWQRNLNLRLDELTEVAWKRGIEI